MINNTDSTYLLSTNSPLQNVKQILNKTTENSKEKFQENDLTNIKIESSEDAVIKKEIEDLMAFEQMVISHEKKHMAAGGGIASAPTYIYTYGPDGKKYVSGGNVSMRVPKAATAEDMIKNLRKVQTAALAPGTPSPQDIQTAAMAKARESSIQNEYKVKQAKEQYEKQQETADMMKRSKQKNMDTIDRMVEQSYENPLEKMKYETKLSFEMVI